MDRRQMIETAFVSGMRGKALYRSGDLFYSLHYDGSSFSVRPGEFAELLRTTHEYESFENVRLDELQERLSHSIRQHNGLFFSLTLLDSAIPLTTRVLVAQAATELFRTESVFESVRNRLFARPLPVQYRVNRHEVVSPLISFSTLHRLLHDLFDAQPIIDEIRLAWDETSATAGVDSTTIEDFESDSVEAGFFYSLFQSILNKDLQRLNSAVV